MAQKISVFFILLCGFVTDAQVGGERVYQFLNLVSSPRQAALGGKTITNFDYDVNQALYNPATINVEMDNQLSVNYVSHLGAVNYGTAAYAYTWDRHLQTFHIGTTYVNYGTFDGYDLQGNSTGTFSGNEVALSLGYAYNILGTDLNVGVNAKLISSKLEQYSSLGGALDIGLFYEVEQLDLHIGAVARNFGTQFTTYAGTREKLPLEVDFGISQKLENVPVRWHLTFENLQNWNIAFSNPARADIDLEGNVTNEKVGFLNDVVRHTIIGIELFPDKGFNIRLGYNFRRAEELKIIDQRSFSGLSAGIGIKLKKLRFSYSHSKYSTAANTNLFGLHINLQ
jgi:hypothetical protein